MTQTEIDRLRLLPVSPRHLFIGGQIALVAPAEFSSQRRAKFTCLSPMSSLEQHQ